MPCPPETVNKNKLYAIAPRPNPANIAFPTIIQTLLKLSKFMESSLENITVDSKALGQR